MSEEKIPEVHQTRERLNDGCFLITDRCPHCNGIVDVLASFQTWLKEKGLRWTGRHAGKEELVSELPDVHSGELLVEIRSKILDDEGLVRVAGVTSVTVPPRSAAN